MGSMPRTRYARSGDVSLAYQDFGHGPVTLFAVPPLARNIELAWESPQYRRYFNRVASFSRYVHFDKRGTGTSDRTLPMPSLETRVDDMRAVMDAAGVDRAFLWGSSEGGPMALLFAATYPDRVEGLVLDGTAAVLVPAGESPEGREQRLARRERWLSVWGTEHSLTLEFMAPSMTSDPWYRTWQPRYERQSASPAALRELISMNDEIDVTPILRTIDVPTLARHRVGDRVVPIERARETVAGMSRARLVEFPGNDHFAHIGADIDEWLVLVEKFITGAHPRVHRSRPGPRQGRSGPAASIKTLGGFAVIAADGEVPLSAWGSRRARQLCKRLTAACGRPLPREQLVDFLWPDDLDQQRLSARLSVQLSTVRRILRGGVIADRDSVRIDLSEVRLDLAELLAAGEVGDCRRVVELYTGEYLPSDLYEDWAVPTREGARAAFARAAGQLANTATTAGDYDQAAALARRILSTDQFDEEAHRLLIAALVAAGHAGAARQAHALYVSRMNELGVPPVPFNQLLRAPSVRYFCAERKSKEPSPR